LNMFEGVRGKLAQRGEEGKALILEGDGRSEKKAI